MYFVIKILRIVASTLLLPLYLSLSHFPCDCIHTTTSLPLLSSCNKLHWNVLLLILSSIDVNFEKKPWSIQHFEKKFCCNLHLSQPRALLTRDWSKREQNFASADVPADGPQREILFLGRLSLCLCYLLCTPVLYYWQPWNNYLNVQFVSWFFFQIHAFLVDLSPCIFYHDQKGSVNTPRETKFNMKFGCWIRSRFHYRIRVLLLYLTRNETIYILSIRETI